MVCVTARMDQILSRANVAVHRHMKLMISGKKHYKSSRKGDYSLQISNKVTDFATIMSAQLNL